MSLENHPPTPEQPNKYKIVKHGNLSPGEIMGLLNNLDTFLTEIAGKGDVVRFNVLGIGQKITVVSNPDLASKMLGSGKDAPRLDRNLSSNINTQILSSARDVQRVLERLLSPNSIFTADDENWKKFRIASVEVMRQSHEMMLKTIAHHADKYAASIEKRIVSSKDGTITIDVLSEMRSLALEIIQNIILGKTIDHNSKAISDALDELVGQIYTDFSLPPIAKLANMFTNRPEKFAGSFKIIDDFLNKTLTAIRDHTQNTDKQPGLLENLANLKSDSGKRQALTDAEIKSMVLTFLLAGHETTASGLAWALHELSIHPLNSADVDKLTKAEKTKNYTYYNYKDKDQLKPALQAADEALRLHPPIPVVIRQCLDDIEIDGVKFTKGELIFFPVSAINSHPQVWGEDANKFIYDREEPDDKILMTFNQPSAKSCPGRALARMEMALIIAKLFTRFTIVPANLTTEIEANVTFTNAPKNLKLSISKR